MRSPTAYAILLLSTCVASPALAQPATIEPAMTLHPGDTIDFRPNDDHRVRFGPHPNPNTPTSTYAEIKRLLQLPPDILALCDSNNDSDTDPDVCDVPTETPFTAVVRADADLAAGNTFNFTCGQHNPMVTRVLAIEAPTTPGAVRSFVIDTDSFSWRMSVLISG